MIKVFGNEVPILALVDKRDSRCAMPRTESTDLKVSGAELGLDSGHDKATRGIKAGPSKMVLSGSSNSKKLFN